MLRLCAGALAINLGPRISAVELDVLDIRALYQLDAAFRAAAAFQSGEDLILDLHVPRKVVFAGLKHRARCRHRIAAALHLDRVEIGPVGDMIGGIAFALDPVTRGKLDKLVGTGSYRL